MQVLTYPLFRIKSQNLLLLLTGYFTVALNSAFFQHIGGYILGLEDLHAGIIIVLPVLVFLFIYVSLALFVVKGLTKTFVIPLLIISAVASYTSLSYGILIDVNMVENFVETDPAEARTYVNGFSVMYVTLLGIVPALLLTLTKIEYQRWHREAITRAASFAVALVLFGVIALLFYRDAAPIGRNNRQVQKFIVPTQIVYSVSKYIQHRYFYSQQPFRELGDDAKLADTHTSPELLLVVLGETARAAEYQFDGYSRATNAYTKKAHFNWLGEIESCGTATAQSVPCMFSFLDRSGYSRKQADNQSNVLDVIQKSGVRVIWVDNNSGCKGVCDRVEHLSIPVAKSNPLCDGEVCLDQVLVDWVDNFIGQPLHQDTVVVLHLIGSHGPTYFRRYPAEHRQFKPDCPRSDIQNCSPEEIRNSYDNTILYTDYILAELAEHLQKQSTTLDSAIFYMSDHGESLGESGIYLHGMPWAIAPVEQKTVPGLLWLSKEFASDHRLNMPCTLDHLKSRHLSQDNLSHSLLGMLSIKTDAKNDQMDIFAGCQHA